MWSCRSKLFEICFITKTDKIAIFNPDLTTKTMIMKRNNRHHHSRIRRGERAVLLLRTTSLLGEDSSCRGGSVNIRFDFSRERLARPDSPKALWRFRASTSISPSGRSRLHSHTHLRHIYHTCAQQDIRVYEDDHFEPPIRQSNNPKALSLLHVSI